MAKAYLLPCPKCGRKIAVTASQAGDTIACACGASLEAPGLRQLKQFEAATGQAEELPPIWGLRQGLIFLGAVIVASGLAFSAYLYSQRMALAEPKLTRYSDEKIQEEVDKLTLNQSWSLWLHMETYGVETGDSLEAMNFRRAYEHGVATLQRQIYLGLGAAVVGVLVAIGGLLVRPQR